MYRAYRIEACYRTLGPGFLSIIIERWIDLIFILLFGLCGLILQPVEQVNCFRYTTGGLLFGLILITVAVIASERVRAVVRKPVDIICFKWLRDKLNLLFTGVSSAFRKIDITSLFKIILISIGVWSLYIIGFYFLFLSMRVDLDKLPFLSCLSIVLLVQAFPITFFSFGTREATLIMYLGYFDFTSTEAISVSFLFVLVSIVGLLISGFFWVFRHK